MGEADIRDDADAGCGDLRKARYLARSAHAHLDDGDLMAAGKLEKSLGHAYFVVEVLLAHQDVQPGTEGVGDHLLGGRLAHAAGYSDHGNSKARAVPGGQVAE